MFKKSLGLAAICLFVAVGCKDKNNPIKAVEESTKDKDLQNTFQTECQQKPIGSIVTGLLSGGQTSVKSSRSLYQFVGNRVTRTTQMFTATDCSAEAASFVETGTFEVTKDKNPEGGRGITIKFDKLSVRIASDDGAKLANALTLCGHKDWNPGEVKEVTGTSQNLNCYSTQVPRREETSYRVDAGQLSLENTTFQKK